MRSPTRGGRQWGKSMLEVAGLSVRYGKHLALADAAFAVRLGEIVVLLSANGAGKSSCLKALGGKGSDGARGPNRPGRHGLAGLAPDGGGGRGVVAVAEGRRIFAELDVRENLLLGAYSRRARAAAAVSLS